MQETVEVHREILRKKNHQNMVKKILSLTVTDHIKQNAGNHALLHGLVSKVLFF